VKVLAVGDMHLGRVPGSLPDDLAESARALGPETAWERCVREAISRRVEAVLLAGDVVDRERDFFAGYAMLKRGIETLLEKEIRVIAVAGNHDTAVLPRLADALPELELLGRAGQWEHVALSQGSVVGWSFPTQRVVASPLQNFPPLQPPRPCLGLLHCDRDQVDSPYAPVRSAELEAAPVDAWLLGHIHQPDLAGEKRPIGYLGSVSALRASETGIRGPWLIGVQTGSVVAEQIPLAPLAFDALEVDVTDLEHVSELDAGILAAGKRQVAARIEADALPDALGLRIRLTGEHRAVSALSEAAAGILAQQPVFEASGCRVFVDKIESAVAAPLDLEALARQPDPAGVLARDLLLLTGPDCEARRRLVAEARERMQAAGGIPELQPVDDEVSTEHAARRLIRTGHAVLARLLEQQSR